MPLDQPPCFPSYSPECVEKKGYSRKFGVASDPQSAALSPRERHGSTTSEPKRGDQVVFVAPLCIKGLRLVTLQLPEKFSPIGPGLSDDREMATWHRWLWSPGRGAALFAALGLWVSQRLGGPLSFLLSPFTGPPAVLPCLLAVLGSLEWGYAELRPNGVLRSSPVSSSQKSVTREVRLMSLSEQLNSTFPALLHPEARQSEVRPI
jgi:hypothetical protein